MDGLYTSKVLTSAPRHLSQAETRYPFLRGVWEKETNTIKSSICVIVGQCSNYLLKLLVLNEKLA